MDREYGLTEHGASTNSPNPPRLAASATSAEVEESIVLSSRKIILRLGSFVEANKPVSGLRNTSLTCGAWGREVITIS